LIGYGYAYGLPTSNPIGGAGAYEGPNNVGTGNPANKNQLILSLPSCSVGMYFNLNNSQNMWHSTLNAQSKSRASIIIRPKGTERFIFGAGGTVGAVGKGIVNHSSSANHGDGVCISAMSSMSVNLANGMMTASAVWQIHGIQGTWSDES
jgi:hypothetical protein